MVREGHRPYCYGRNMETELDIGGSTYNCQICLNLLCGRVLMIQNASSHYLLLTLSHGDWATASVWVRPNQAKQQSRVLELT